MIVVTGAAGFIGSCLVRRLNDLGEDALVVADRREIRSELPNLVGKSWRVALMHGELFEWLDTHHSEVEAIYHLGAHTDTLERDRGLFNTLNLNFSKQLWERCARYRWPLLYASSAATYGAGELGYEDRHDLVGDLKPLNEYARSKNDFDAWALAQDKAPPFWAGLKFFNVYGPNEYHKAKMASVIYQATQQIREAGSIRLFRSHRPDFDDGAQARDFIYVQDVLDVCLHLMSWRGQSGLFNVGTGQARSFLDLAQATFAALGQEPEIEFIDIPESIRERYQYFTQASIDKLLATGYEKPFTSLEVGAREYIEEYLSARRCY